MGDDHDQRRSDFPPFGEDAPEQEKKRLFERAIPALVKRLVERAVASGVEKLQEGPENLREFVDDLKLPKEAIHYLYGQIDDTKNGIYRAVAKEIRDVLEQTHFADEITNVLTKLSFEIKTEIRFVPNQVRSSERPPEGDEAEGSEGGAPSEGAPHSQGLPKPQVTAQVSVKDRSKEARPPVRRREGT